MDPLKKFKKTLFLVRRFFLLPVLILFISILTITFFKINLNNQEVNFIIETPKEGAVLNYKQTFKIKVKESVNLENITFYWSVENSELENKLQKINNLTFVDYVNVNEWDWKRNHQYKINFFAKDTYGNTVSERTVNISTRSPLEVAEMSLQEKDFHSELSASAVSTSKKISELEQENSLASNTLSIDYSKIKYGRYVYKFIFRSEKYDPDSIMAFWKSEDGHRNLIFEKNDKNQYQVNIDFSNWQWLGSGPYKVEFFILDRDSKNEIARIEMFVSWEGNNGDQRLVFNFEEQSTNTEIVSKSLNENSKVEDIDNPIVSKKLTQNTNFNLQSESFVFSNFYNPPKPEVRNSLEQTNDSIESRALKYIIDQPWAIWLNNNEYESDNYLFDIIKKAKETQTIPIFVLYNIPNRDCGSHSSGGANSAFKYREWVDRLASILKSTEIIFIIEPDALSQLNCLSEKGRAERIKLIRYAVESLAKLPLAHVYVDAGHPFWINPEEMAERLKEVNISAVSGFALNVSNFASNEDNIQYGDYLSYLTDNSYYIIDTGRNGNGPTSNHEWCNPPGRALGETPRLTKDRDALSAFLWIKCPGESDGTCNGGPPAGHWWKEYAVGLSNNFFNSN